VVFSSHASAQSPSKLGVAPGESVSVAEAIQAMTVLSANDAAVAMAEKLGGSESRFAALMTLRAQELGMRNTQFVNANGLPDSRQLTTARDIAIMSRAVMRDFPQYYHYFGQLQFDFHGRVIGNHNHMLTEVPGVDGLKTGFINAAGFNIAISGVRDNRRLVVVVMGGPSVASRDQNAEDLLLTGFDVMKRRSLGEVTTVAQNLYEAQSSGGAIVRAPTEQGDADQSGLKIIVDSDGVKHGVPEIIQPQVRPAVDTCAARKVVRYVRHHGHRVRVVSTVSACAGAHVTRAADVTCVHGKKGRHGHACATTRRTAVASHGHRRHGHVTKVADESANRRDG